jgi:hypothetical protein
MSEFNAIRQLWSRERQDFALLNIPRHTIGELFGHAVR